MADSDRANTIDEASTTTIPREATSITHLFDALRKVFERNEVVSGPGLGREPILLEASKLETWTSIHNALASEDDPSSLGVILREAPQMAKNILDILGSLRESLAELLPIFTGQQENSSEPPVNFDDLSLEELQERGISIVRNGVVGGIYDAEMLLESCQNYVRLLYRHATMFDAAVEMKLGARGPWSMSVR